MHRAAWNNHTEVVRALIEAKADVNAKTKVNTTPLVVLPATAA